MLSKAKRILQTAIFAAAACKSESDFISWVGENYEHLSEPTFHACGGNQRTLDDFIAFVASELGIPIPEGITYTWLHDAGEANCPEGLKGCARGKAAFSQIPVFPHELVHTVAGPNRMDAWPFFSEGLAVAYDPWEGDKLGTRYLLVPAEGEGDPLPDPRPSLTLPRDKLSYDLAGSFVAFLLSRHGPGPYVAMTQRLSAKRDLDLLRAAFSDSYPTELDDEAEIFMAGADCPADPFPTLVYDCVTPEIAWTTSKAWVYRRSLNCEDDDVAGGYAADRMFPSVHSVTLEVASPGLYVFQVTSDRDVTVQLGACFGCPWENRGTVVAPGSSSSVELEPGPYFVRVVAESNDVPNLEVGLIQL